MVVSGASCPVPRPRVLLLPVIGALVVLAWLNRFIQDDAFISFRYARNLANGHGLVWNPGERVEGYTNFLWTVLMAIPHRLGISPVGFSFGLGLVFFGFSLYVTYHLAKAAIGAEGPALLAVVLLGTNYTFSAFATSGMETQLQAFLFVLAALLLLRLDGRGKRAPIMLSLSLILGLAVLTRPDSVLLVVILLPLAVRRVWQEREGRGRSLLVLALPFAAVVGPWLVWKTIYYGRLFPNTFYAKSPDLVSLLRGVYFLGAFAGFYLLFLILPWVVQAGRRLVRQREPKLLVLAVATGLWVVYVLVFGGDFMQFRLVVPAMPFLFILLVWTLCNVVRSQGLRAGLVGLMLVGSGFCGFVHGRGVFNRGAESIRRLSAHMTAASDNWPGIGVALRRAFDGNPSVLIAVTTAGAIPYYSGLRTVDMLGLNDPWVARHGRRYTSHPGHRRVATLGYLASRGVNLVIGHPAMVSSDSEAGAVRLKWFVQGFEPSDSVPEGSRFVEIPVDRGYHLVALYLTRSRVVDSVIARQGWRTWPVPTSAGLD